MDKNKENDDKEFEKKEIAKIEEMLSTNFFYSEDELVDRKSGLGYLFCDMNSTYTLLSLVVDPFGRLTLNIDAEELGKKGIVIKEVHSNDK